jgi:hypothetical protein
MPTSASGTLRELVTTLYETFFNAVAFNRDLGEWNTARVSNMDGRSGAMFRADTMRVNDAKKAAKLQGGITQQSAEDATFRQSGVDVESARSAGLIPPVNSALMRAFANHKPLAQKETIAPEGGPSAPKVGPQRSSRLPVRFCQP